MVEDQRLFGRRMALDIVACRASEVFFFALNEMNVAAKKWKRCELETAGSLKANWLMGQLTSHRGALVGQLDLPQGGASGVGAGRIPHPVIPRGKCPRFSSPPFPVEIFLGPRSQRHYSPGKRGK